MLIPGPPQRGDADPGAAAEPADSGARGGGDRDHPRWPPPPPHRRELRPGQHPRLPGVRQL